MRDTFYQLALALARRKTGKQKTRFLAYMSEAFKNLGYPCEKVTDTTGKPVRQQLFAGDAQKADKYLVTAYPSQNRQLLVNRFYPFRDDINRKNELINLAADVSLALLSLCGGFLLFYFGAGAAREWLRVCMIAAGALLAAYAYSIASGRGAYVNFLQSGALALSLSLASEKRKKIAYVFCDSAVGSPDYLKKFEYKKTSLDGKTVLMLDLFSAGSAVLIAFGKNARGQAEGISREFGGGARIILEEREFGDIGPLEKAKCIYIASGETDSEGRFYVPGWKSGKNKRVDFDLLENAKKSIGSILWEDH